MNTLQFDNATFFPHFCQLVNEGHNVSLRTRGCSMRPFIEHDRDIAVLGPLKHVEVGDVVLAEIRVGKYVMHRIDKIEGDKVVLRGDGNYPGTEVCKKEDLRALMVAVERKGKTYSTDGRTWKVYSYVWTRLLPLRPYLLTVYRLLWHGQLPRGIRRLLPEEIVKQLKKIKK